MRRPAHLKPGDKIGIVAPSSPVKAEDLEKGIACLTARGYQVEVAPHVLDRLPHCDFLAGADADRASDLNSFFACDDIHAILCARGGYGSLRLLDRLDWETIRAHPKLFIGYSDITSLHLALAREANLVTFHAPMATAHPKLDETAARIFWQLLEEPKPLGTLPADSNTMQTIVPGIVEGELAGGNLCLLAQSYGSRYAPDFRGKIVLIEDVGETIYRADRNLWQLKNAGAFDEAVGFIIGSLTNWQKMEADPPNNTPHALWQDFFVPLGKPTLTSLPFGHEPNPLSLPLGVRASLNAEVRTLTLLESATI